MLQNKILFFLKKNLNIRCDDIFNGAALRQFGFEAILLYWSIFNIKGVILCKTEKEKRKVDAAKGLYYIGT